MDFLDSLDYDAKNKKSCRVRSWYLYEQYKSLENHQLDAAQRLKDKTYQDRMLRQELSDRRARRKLYGHFGLCYSESMLIRRPVNKDCGQFSVSTDGFFENYNEDEPATKDSDSVNEAFSQDSSPNKINMKDYKNLEQQGVISANRTFIGDFESLDDQKGDIVRNKCYVEFKEGKEQNDRVNTSIIGDYKSADEQDIVSDSTSFIGEYDNLDERKDNISCPHSVVSVVDNIEPNEQYGDYDYCKQNQFASITIAQNLNKQLEFAQQNIKRLENITQLQDDNEKSWDNVSEYSTDSCKTNNLCDHIQKETGNIVAVWTRLVSFAYQLVQLNHGNCYSDYSSQFLTAVLACDVLRRGVSHMCNILQPYVSPIKFVSEELYVPECCYENVKHEKLVQSRKSNKTLHNKQFRRSRRYKSKRRANIKSIENCWHSYYKHSHKKRTKYRKSDGASGSWCSANNPLAEMFSSSDSSLWPQYSRGTTSKTCSCKKAVNSMLQIARYIDRVLKDVGNSVSTCENCL